MPFGSRCPLWRRLRNLVAIIIDRYDYKGVLLHRQRWYEHSDPGVDSDSDTWALYVGCYQKVIQ